MSEPDWKEFYRREVLQKQMLSKECERLLENLQEDRGRLTTLEQLLQNIIAAHCGHYADVERVVALQRAITEADEFLNV